MTKFNIGDKVRLINEREPFYVYIGDDPIGEIISFVPENSYDYTYWGARYRVLFDVGEQLVHPSQIELVEGKQMKIPYTLTNTSCSLFLNGKMFTVSRDDTSFNQVVEHLKEDTHDEDVLLDLLDRKKTLTNLSEGKVTISGNDVLYDGEPIRDTLSARLMDILTEGLDVRPWMRFMDNLMKNPSYKSRESLFNFLDQWQAPITEDGCFLAFKNVRSDFKDIHSGKFDNSPGQVVVMDRTKVDDDSNRTCSAGLHACATSYLKSFYVDGAKTVVVKINPRDVVAVPVDYNFAKMRVCQYEVLREVTPTEVAEISSSNYYKTQPRDEYGRFASY